MDIHSPIAPSTVWMPVIPPDYSGRNESLESQIVAICGLNPRQLPPAADSFGIAHFDDGHRIDIEEIHARCHHRISYWRINGLAEFLPTHFPRQTGILVDFPPTIRRPRPLDWSKVALWLEVEQFFWQTIVVQADQEMNGSFLVAEIDNDLIDQLATFIWQNRSGWID